LLERRWSGIVLGAYATPLEGGKKNVDRMVAGRGESRIEAACPDLVAAQRKEVHQKEKTSYHQPPREKVLLTLLTSRGGGKTDLYSSVVT